MVSKKSKAKKFEFKGFHNLEFTPDQRQSISHWMKTFGEEPTDAAVVLVEAGYKVSIGYDDYHSTYQVSLTCKDTASTYCGYCFTLKHNDIGRGLLILRYVYDSQLKDEVMPLDQPPGDFDW